MRAMNVKMNLGAVWPFAVATGVLLSVVGGCGSSGSGDSTRPAPGPNVRSIVEEVRTQSGVPALAGAYLTTRDISDWATGIREVGQSGEDNTVKRDDLFQINSNAKASTATLAARLVEKGQIRFDATPGDLFPNLAAEMNPQLRNVTLEQLLNHRGGNA